jgi:predicted permease
MDTLEILLPVIIILSLGLILRKTGFLSADFTSGLGKLAY